MISFAEALNQTLANFRITAKELAMKSGVKESNISELRNGKTDPRISTIESLINALPEEARNYLFFKVFVSNITDRDVSNLLSAIAIELRNDNKTDPTRHENKELVLR